MLSLFTLIMITVIAIIAFCFLTANIRQKNVPYKFKSNNKNCHAEVNLLSSVSKFIKNENKNKKIDILVVRLNKEGTLSNSKPCLHCVIHMKKYYSNNIRYIYYSNSHGEINRNSLNELLENTTHISKKYKI